MRSDLDDIAPERPALIIESSLHQGTMNSAALAAIGWGRSTPRWPGGELARDRRGEPNGLAWEQAFGVPVLKAVQAELDAEPDVVPGRLRSVADGLLARGITHAAEAFTPPQMVKVFEQASLPLGVTMLPTSGRGLLTAPLDVLDGPRTGEGDARLGYGPIKLVADGAERGAMCFTVPQFARTLGTTLLRSFTTRDARSFRFFTSLEPRIEGWKVRTGMRHYSAQTLADISAAALARGFRVAIHALGNEALGMALDALEEGRRATGKEVDGCRIEHAMFARPRDFARAARLGLTLSMQPGHAAHYGPAIRMMGIDRVFEPVALRHALEAGCRVAISSDGPTIPTFGLENVRAALIRIDVEGQPVGPGQAVSKTDAMRAATIGGAEACGVEGTKGSIAVGKQADFAVLSGDPFDRSTGVLQTWVAGRKVWPA
jgi:predicted amidohydrolase YtcJ